MNKQELASAAGVGKDDVEKVFDAIASELQNGGEVAIAGFGKFSVSHRAARQGRNPATGETIQIAASKVPKFTAGAGLKKAVK